jgi:hypothetical protein
MAHKNAFAMHAMRHGRNLKITVEGNPGNQGRITILSVLGRRCATREGTLSQSGELTVCTGNDDTAFGAGTYIVSVKSGGLMRNRRVMLAR